VAITRDGKHAFTGSWYRAVLWDAESGKELQSFPGPGGGGTKDKDGQPLPWEKLMICAAMNGDGTCFVTGNFDGTAIVWDAGGKKLHTLKGHRGEVLSVAFSGDGKYIATGSRDASAILWDRASGKKLQTFNFTESILHVALSADGGHLVAGHRIGAFVWETVLLSDMIGGKLIREFTAVEDGVASLALSRDGKHMVTGQRATAILWDTASGKKLQSFAKNTSALTSLAVSRSGRHVVTGSPSYPNYSDTSAVLWEVAGGKRRQTFKDVIEGHSISVTSVAVSGDGKHVVTGSDNAGRTGGVPLTIWDADSGKKLKTFQGARGFANVALSGDGNRVAAGTSDGKAILWEVDSGKKRTLLEDTPYRGHALIALSSDGTVLVTLDQNNIADGKVGTGKPLVWDAASGKRLHTLQDPPSHTVCTSLAVSSNGKHVVAGTTGTYFNNDRGAVFLWDISGKKRKLFMFSHAVYSVAVSDDRKLVASATSDGKAIMLDTANGKKRQTVAANVTCVALSADGKHLWTAGNDGATRLWDATTGKERCRLYSFDSGKDWLVVTPDGFFDGSEGAWQFVAYRVPGTLNLADDDVTRRRFHRPGLLAKIWQGK
jgi:WD40 repeat protein